jgi:hypothetical protein
MLTCPRLYLDIYSFKYMVRILPLPEENLGDIQKSFKAHLHGRLKMSDLQKNAITGIN